MKILEEFDHLIPAIRMVKKETESFNRSLNFQFDKKFDHRDIYILIDRKTNKVYASKAVSPLTSIVENLDPDGEREKKSQAWADQRFRMVAYFSEGYLRDFSSTVGKFKRSSFSAFVRSERKLNAFIPPKIVLFNDLPREWQ